MAICGAGAFGTALGKVLRSNKHRVRFYDNHKLWYSLRYAMEEADAVVIAVPAEAINELLEEYPEDKKDLPVILATKGLLNLDMFEGFSEFGLLSGPAFAATLMGTKKATLTATHEMAKTLFAGRQVTIELTDDEMGVLYCGSLKNVYAIGAGYSCENKDDVKVYVAQALQELRLYLEAHGARGATADLACGYGDLLLTCSSEESRNFRFGKMLANGVDAESAKAELGTVEGLVTLAELDYQKYALLTYVHEIIDS